MINAALQHATTVTMGGNLDAVLSDSIVDELNKESVSAKRNTGLLLLTWLSSGASLLRHF